MGQGVNRYAKTEGADAYMRGSRRADANAQVRVIQNLVASNVDALAVVPFQPDAVEKVLARAMRSDITVITHEAPEIQNADWDIEAFQNDDYGRNLMDQLANSMDEQGQYAVMVGSLSSATHMIWVQSAVEYQKQRYPDMQHVGEIVQTQDDAQVAYQKTKELLSAYPNLKGIQGSASTDVIGAGQAVEAAGLQDEVSVVGTSVPSEAKTGLKNGSIDLVTLWDPADAGYAMNALAEVVMDGKAVKDGLNLGVDGYESVTVDGKVVYGDKAWITVTEQNVNEFDF
jgi:simple sugar transport system substrate-binding protein